MYVIHIQMPQSFKAVGWLYQLWRLSTKVDFCNGGSVGNPCWNKKRMGFPKRLASFSKVQGLSWFILTLFWLRKTPRKPMVLQFLNPWFDTWWREFRVSRVCYSFLSLPCANFHANPNFLLRAPRSTQDGNRWRRKFSWTILEDVKTAETPDLVYSRGLAFMSQIHLWRVEDVQWANE